MEFATIVAEKVLVRLASYTSQEISLAGGAQLELTKFNKTLSTIKLLLKDAERKQLQNPLITHWLGNLKDVCHDVDDLLDEVEFRKLRMKVLVNNSGSVKGKITANQNFLKTLISRFKYMRVLDLSETSLEELPSSIDTLCHLRFLNLGGNVELKRLPNSICKLLNLQCLSLVDCDALEEIPSDMWNLINLRSLEITTKQVDLPKGIRRLTLLQVLSFVKCVNLKSLGEEIQYLTNLRKQAINECEKLESLPPNMKRLTALDTLWIMDCEKLKLTGSGEGPQRLRSLIIKGSDMEDLPPWLQESAHTLQSIIIQECENLTKIEKLQNFTSLEFLVIGDCPKLLALPQGLHCLTELRELAIEECPELIESCKRQLKGEDWSKIARDVKIVLDGEVWSPEKSEREE